MLKNPNTFTPLEISLSPFTALRVVLRLIRLRAMMPRGHLRRMPLSRHPHQKDYRAKPCTDPQVLERARKQQPHLVVRFRGNPREAVHSVR